MKPAIPLTLIILLAVSIAACGGDATEPAESSASTPAALGVELPITEIELGPIDTALVARGQQVFETRCLPCHRMDERYIGPPLGDIVGQRAPEHIMNMILAPEKMLMADSIAQQLLAEYSVPMTNQNLSQDQARAILEYLRHVHEGD